MMGLLIQNEENYDVTSFSTNTIADENLETHVNHTHFTRKEDDLDPRLTHTDTKEYFNGPDQCIPCDDIKTFLPTGCVKLKIGERGNSSRAPISVPTLLRKSSENFPSYRALSVKREGKWSHLNFREYYELVRTVAKAFIALGLQMYHGVCILGFNSPEWFISDLAAIFAGGFAAGIYTTNSPEACEHCARNCKAQIWVVEDQKQLEKVLKIRDNLPHLNVIIQYSGTPTVEGVLSWKDVINIGNVQTDHELENRLRKIAINQCCTLIYTSGTTGPPKGVMLSHDNITFTASVSSETIKSVPGKDVFVSYLPLSHVAAQMADIYVCIYSATSVYFAQPDALKGTLINTLKEVRPTRFLGVPRVWEKIYEKMMDIGRKTTGVKKYIATWAKSVGSETNKRKQISNFSKPVGYSVANALVFKKVKANLGLDRCALFLSGAAPIAPEVISYFHSLDICLTEIYGMSETAGPHCICLPKSFKLSSVGKTLEGCYTKISNPDHENVGEICMGGRNICMGYLQMEETTHEAIDEEGWLHSGDLGKLDDEKFLYITGRIKELIITAGGENIPPVLIEDHLKNELPCISNAILIGDRRKFLSVLITIKTNVDEEGEPLDSLAPATIEWCQNLGSKCATMKDILKPDEVFMRAIQEGINRTNAKSTSNAQKIQKWTVLPRDFTVSGDELGPTLKLKRPVVMKKYYETIENLYL